MSPPASRSSLKNKSFGPTGPRGCAARYFATLAATGRHTTDQRPPEDGMPKQSTVRLPDEAELIEPFPLSHWL
jgi:hypothetical protein